MTISIDGFAADENLDAGRLYPDLAALRHTACMKDAIEQTGAVLVGRRTFEMGNADSYVGNYEFQVPIFVLTHHPPSVAPKQDEHLTSAGILESHCTERIRTPFIMPLCFQAFGYVQRRGKDQCVFRVRNTPTICCYREANEERRRY